MSHRYRSMDCFDHRRKIEIGPKGLCGESKSQSPEDVMVVSQRCCSQNPSDTSPYRVQTFHAASFPVPQLRPQMPP